jgi:hypothetical protein
VGNRGYGTAEGKEKLSGDVWCHFGDDLLWRGWLKEPFVVVWKAVGDMGPMFDGIVPPFGCERGLIPKETADPFYECLD